MDNFFVASSLSYDMVQIAFFPNLPSFISGRAFLSGLAVISNTCLKESCLYSFLKIMKVFSSPALCGISLCFSPWAHFFVLFYQ